MTIAIIILSSVILTMIFYILKMHERLSQVTADKNNAEALYEAIKKTTSVEIEPGDTGLVHDFDLQCNGKDGSHVFSVDFEVEVLQVSEKRLKVSATNFTSSATIANDPTKKAGIINFFQNQWIERKQFEVIYDDRKRRNQKLNDLGI